MSRSILMASLVVAALSNGAYACSPPFNGFYEPEKVKKRVPSSEIPRPILFDLELVRGTEGDGMSCDDAGQMNFRVRLPEGSNVDLEAFGLKMTLVEGSDPYGIIYDEPFALWDFNQRGFASISLWWLDGARKYHKPLNMKIDVTLVSGDAVGSPTRIRIQKRK